MGTISLCANQFNLELTLVGNEITNSTGMPTRPSQAENFPARSPQGNQPDTMSCIERYLESRMAYYESVYSKKSVGVMLAGEARALKEAYERGELSGWQGEVDPFQHIANIIQKRFQQPEGSYRTSLDKSNFSPELHALLQQSEVPNSGVMCIWMNDSGTLTCPCNNTVNHEILSIGQCGCTQVVLASADTEDTRISVIHFDPTKISALLDSLETRAAVHQDRKTDAIIFINPDEDASLIELAAQRLLPSARVHIVKLDLSSSSQDPDANVLRCQPQENGTVSVSLKDWAGTLLADKEPKVS